MMIRLIIILLFLPFFSFSQTKNDKLADSIKFITEMPYISSNTSDCGSELFWKIVKQKKGIIPILIDNLNDTTQVNAFVPNFGGNWTVADIAYTAINEIIKGVPTFELLGINYDIEGCGYCAYWNYLRSDFKNRKKFQLSVSKWYEMNKNNLVWVTSNEFLTCDCRGQHPNGGHYELRK